jgi:hypothetical protein
MNKNLLSTILTLVIAVGACAQPIIKQQRTIGGSRDDLFTTMCLTRDGGFIEGGYSISGLSGEKTEDFKGGYDYWIVKLDKRGSIQWDKTIGGSQNDYLQVVLQSNDGGYLLGGYSWSPKFGDKSQDSRGAEDFWVVKLDSAGNKQWDKTIGGSLGDELTAMQQTSDGGYILGGFSSSSKSGEKTQDGKGLLDFWIVKIDAIGNIQWDKTIGGSDYDQLSRIQQTTDGGYILGGFSKSNISFDKTGNNRGGNTNDYWLVKTDASGNIQWDKTIGGKKDDVLTAMQQTVDGGYIIGGWSASNISGEKTQASRGGNDYWVVKTDASGNIQWDKTIGGNAGDNLNAMQQTGDGGYILAGFSGSENSGEKTEGSRGNYDYWVVKTNSTGTIEWDKTIGGSIEDFLVSIMEVKKNQYLLGGYSQSGISGEKTENSRGLNDYWTVLLTYKPESKSLKTTPVAKSLHAAAENMASVHVYPNPATNILHIKNTGKASFNLSDQSGKILLTKTITNNGSIDVSKLPTGVYFLVNTKTNQSQQVVINK